MSGEGIEYFRVDRSAKTRRLLTAGVCFIALGTSGIATNFFRPLAREVSGNLTLAGIALLLFGLVLSFGSMALLVFENHYVAVRVEGLLLHRNESEELVRWEDVERIAAEAAEIVVHRRASAPIRWYMGGAVAALAAHLETRRSQAAHGLLRPSTPPIAIKGR